METAPVNRRRLCAAVWCVIVGLLLSSGPRAVAGPTTDFSTASPAAPAAFEPVHRIAAWPPWLRGTRQLFDRGPAPVPAVPAVPDTPHPAVARIIVPESGATAYGSGTLIDVRDEFGLVITNWHVVRDSEGIVEVVFPNGFRSHARPLKVDSDWDLAALVIWRPQIEPVKVSAVPPQPGDPLTIHGYGQGQYRIASGRCTAYYAPRLHFPREMVELDVEARQGDSGGPIFNQQGELAGVLFGAGEGTTIGSFAPRVESFLASLAPDIGGNHGDAQLAVADRQAPAVHPVDKEIHRTASMETNPMATPEERPSSPWNPITPVSQSGMPAIGQQAEASVSQFEAAPSGDWFDGVKSALALVGLAAVALQLIRLAR